MGRVLNPNNIQDTLLHEKRIILYCIVRATDLIGAKLKKHYNKNICMYKNV